MKIKSKLRTFCILTLTFSVFACNSESDSKASENVYASKGNGVHMVKMDDFKGIMNAIKDYQLVDVRTPAEIQGGKMEGAIESNIQEPTFVPAMDELDRSKPIFVYCASGKRSAHAAEILKDMGFNEVYSLDDTFR